MYFLTLCQQKCTKWHWPAADLYNCSLLSGHCPRPGPASVPPGVASSPGWKYHIWSPERAGGTPPGRRAHGKHSKKHWENGYTFVNISAYSPARNIIQVCNINTNSAELFVIYQLWKYWCITLPFHIKTICYYVHISNIVTLYIEIGLNGEKYKHLTSISLSLGDRLQIKLTFQINGNMNMSSESCEGMLESFKSVDINSVHKAL